MCFVLKHFRMLACLGLLALLAQPAWAAPGWMGFRNDTSATLIIQETGAGRPGRPQKIFANETVRDTPASGGARKFAIYAADKPDKPLYTGLFPVPGDNENVLYVIKSDGKGGLTIDATKTPAGGPKTPTPPPSKPKKKE
jgi:hypothetical protein